MSEIILYSNNCPKCKILKEKLDNANVVYRIETDLKIMLELGFIQMPVLMIDGEKLNFMDSIKWIDERTK